MELNNIKLETTWNDAAARLNENFAKLKQAIALGSLGHPVMLDTEMSDESENVVQNKVIKKYVDDLEANIKENPSEFVPLKTINGKPIYGEGNIVIEGGNGGTGLQYSVERTVYLTRSEFAGYEPIDGEITEEERAYNIETYDMAWNRGEPVFVSFNGCHFNVIVMSDEMAVYNVVSHINNMFDHDGLYSLTIVISKEGDAIFSSKPIQTGGGSAIPSDMNSDFSNDF